MDIQSYVGRTSPVSVKCNGDARYPCPSCGGKDKLEVSTTGLFYCHKCELKGKFGTGGAGTRAVESTTAVGEDRLDLYMPAPLDSPHVAYLEGRGYKGQLLRDLDPYTGPNDNYVYLPVTTMWSTSPQYFIGRAINDQQLRYLNPRGDHFRSRRSELLWGSHRFRFGPRRLVVCEGIFDAVWGRDRVATFGLQVSTKQMEAIADMEPEEVVVCFDATARSQAITMAGRLSKYYTGPIRVATLPGTTDPDDLRQDCEQYIDAAERVA